MLFRTAIWSGALIFIITLLSGGIAEPQAPLKNPAASPAKKWAVVKGFRSAQFGMNEKSVYRAITKDFDLSNSKVKRSVHPTEKTTSMKILIPDLFRTGGAAKIVYLLGYQSRKLFQVNIVWGKGAAKKVDGQGVVDTANLLRTHFIKKRYKKKGLVVNGKLDETNTIVFRGRDQKDRMILLMLTTPKTKKGEAFEEAIKNVSLKLSYLLKPDNPDILTVKDDEF
jgi:hypothetical protein